MVVTGDTPLSQALWYTGPAQCAIDVVPCGAPRAGEVLVQTLFSGISRGTEGLVFRGEVPESEWQRMRAPFQAGDFPYPVKYGYANVGRVLEGDPDLAGRIVFSLYPHQSVFVLPSSACVPVPAGIPAERAVLAANMETAINALWDGKPSPGDHICVVGGGVVGLLTAYLASRLPGSRVTLVDTNAAREETATDLGLNFALPEHAPRDQDLVFHTSASSAGLATALACAGDGTSVVEMSWYGSRDVLAPLGADFHCRRLKLVSSQVGTIPVERQARWTFRRRLETALSLLQDPALDRLISHRVDFPELPAQLPELLNKASDVLTALVVYDSGPG
ncbi:zinc-dependent alcohol dehydrogenase [Roseibium marinum]|uniref:Threonine dehydrogenase-like Zn-dependent dehydrogenase n=1 Tax=Roseibium marinum TaxID=281252 RepID=A0A2S3V2U8_9HYPH|nr:zinc-binding alcohol dehydrogenase [Roseibium marinum]POF34301.1 threonine dehydrogenase-like Zn-dependent dehydrogenase [Roseibium marinum]